MAQVLALKQLQQSVSGEVVRDQFGDQPAADGRCYRGDLVPACGYGDSLRDAPQPIGGYSQQEGGIAGVDQRSVGPQRCPIAPCPASPSSSRAEMGL
jgi:hypothetical protein